MHEYKGIEEPPPIPRSMGLPPGHSLADRFVGWRTRPSVKRPGPASGHAARSANPKVIVLGLIALTVIGMQAWTLHRLARVRTDLSAAGARLDEARGSLGMLWDTTRRLDEDQMGRLAHLTDSIRSVFAYAQGEVRLWEAAFYAQEQRLDDNAGVVARNGEAITRMTTAARTVNTRLDEFAGADEAQRSRLDALENQDRTQGSVVEALARRAQTQEATVLGVTTTLATLRETLANVDAEIAGLEDQLASSGSAYGQMGRSIEGLTGWVDGFRRAGLSGEAVESRLSALAAEVRRVRLRVDSLRLRGAAVGAAERTR